jgi:hypothetical protein
MLNHRSLPFVIAVSLAVALGTTVQADEQKPAQDAPKAAAQEHGGRRPQSADHPQGHTGGPAAPAQSAAPAPGRPSEHSPGGTRGPGHPGEEHREIAHERHEFHEHDVHRFNHEELALWRGGGWHQEWHNGRFGWWWLAGGVWYFYERPVYPYPLVIAETTYVEPVVAPPVVVPAMPAPAPAAVAPAGPPPQQFWYYCDNPPGYYPYVATCNTNYREVAVPSAPPR